MPSTVWSYTHVKKSHIVDAAINCICNKQNGKIFLRVLRQDIFDCASSSWSDSYFYFRYTVGTNMSKITLPEISLNTQDFFSLDV
jgi:hypothetical protein